MINGVCVGVCVTQRRKCNKETIGEYGGKYRNSFYYSNFPVSLELFQSNY